MHPSQHVCDQRRSAAKFETCACPKCQPGLHSQAVHQADLKQFSLLRGLTWRGHDAWRIACFAVSSFADIRHTQKNNPRWTAWCKKYQLHQARRTAAHELNESAINEVIEIFSEIFFLGQLPSSKFRVRWASLFKHQLESLDPQPSPKDPMTLWLNQDHAPLRYCARQILCVVLHEMAHAFFDYYTCWPWTKPRCAGGACGKLYQLNIGLTGHGRAWQYLILNIQQTMHHYLGFHGDLGRRGGMYTELEAGGTGFCSLSAWVPEADSLVSSVHPMLEGRQDAVPVVPLAVVGMDCADEGRRCGDAHRTAEVAATQEGLGVGSVEPRAPKLDLRSKA